MLEDLGQSADQRYLAMDGNKGCPDTCLSKNKQMSHHCISIMLINLIVHNHIQYNIVIAAVCSHHHMIMMMMMKMMMMLILLTILRFRF